MCLCVYGVVWCGGVCGVEYMSVCACMCVCVWMVNLIFHSLMELMGIILLYGFRQIVHLYYWHFQVSAAESNESWTKLYLQLIYSAVNSAR